MLMLREKIRRVRTLLLAHPSPMGVESGRDRQGDFAIPQLAQTERDGADQTIVLAHVFS